MSRVVSGHPAGKRFLAVAIALGFGHGLLTVLVLALPSIATFANLYLRSVGLTANFGSFCTFVLQPVFWCHAAYYPQNLSTFTPVTRWLNVSLSSPFYGLSGAALFGLYRWSSYKTRSTPVTTPDSHPHSKDFALIVYLLINFSGLMLDAYFSGMIVHLAKLEGRSEYDGVDGITYFCTGGLVDLFCFVLNAAWAIVAVVDIIRRRDYTRSVVLTVMIVMWVALFLTVRAMSAL